MKIALIGSAPSSISLAPYEDEEWTIWGCSPAAAKGIKRVDAWFELHRYTGREPHIPPDYVEWMSKLTCPVYMIEHSPNVPPSIPYPTDEMLEAFGRHFFTSSLAWMMALAITAIGREGSGEHSEHEIGLWGVDMAADDEYIHQKGGCLYFIEIARQRGIKVTVPPESDLLQPMPLYGIGEASPMRIKLTVRQEEMIAKRNERIQQSEKLKADWEAAIRDQMYLQGALEDVQYMLNTWCE